MKLRDNFYTFPFHRWLKQFVGQLQLYQLCNYAFWQKIEEIFGWGKLRVMLYEEMKSKPEEFLKKLSMLLESIIVPCRLVHGQKVNQAGAKRIFTLNSARYRLPFKLERRQQIR